MNRRQLIASMFSAALLRTADTLGVLAPIIHTPRRWTIDEILEREAHRLGHDIHRRLLNPSPWLALAPEHPNNYTHGSIVKIKT